MAIQITDQNAAEILATDQLVVIDFWATWCGPCLRLTPIIDQLSEEYSKKPVVFCKYNVDEGMELRSEYNIRNIPVLLFIKNGELKHKLVGAASKASVQEQIEKYI